MDKLEFRNHPTIMIEQARSLIGTALVLIIGVISPSSDDVTIPLYVKIIIAAVVIAYVVLAALIWYKTKIILNDGLLTIRLDTVMKRKTEIRVETISNVNLEQNLMERIFGTCRVKIDTASLTKANKTDVNIVLKKTYASSFKEAILMMQAGEDVAPGLSSLQSDSFLQKETPDVSLTTKQLAMSGIMNISFLSLAAALISLWSGLYGAAGDGNWDGMISGMNVMTFITVSIVFIGFFSDILKRGFGYWNFTAKKDGERILISYGIITKKKYAIPIDKINGYTTESTFLGSVFGYSLVRILNVGGEGKEAYGQVLLPPVRKDMLHTFINKLLPSEMIEEEEASVGMTRAYGNYRIFRNVLLPIGLTGIAAVLFAKYLRDWILLAPACGAAVVFFVVFWTVRSNRAASLGYSRSCLVIESGGLGLKKAWIPFSSVQFIERSAGPVARRLNSGAVNAHILSGGGGDRQSCPAVSDEIFSEIYEKFEETY